MKVAKATSKAWSLVLVVAAYGIAIVERVADVQLHRFIRDLASGRWRCWACSSAAAFR
jgi:hypothetical protein